MILVDTSVWVLILRDKTGGVVAAFQETVGSEVTVLSRFNQLELLQGAKDSREWQLLLEASTDTWRQAAAIFFDLRRKGVTVSSPVDCCIAQIALESDALLLHCDHDFERIATVRELDEEYFSWQ
jgi:predicted nucleic acid-binding protein